MLSWGDKIVFGKLLDFSNAGLLVVGGGGARRVAAYEISLRALEEVALFWRHVNSRQSLSLHILKQSREEEELW